LIKNGALTVLIFSRKGICGKIYVLVETGVPLSSKILEEKIGNGSVLQNGIKHIRKILFINPYNKAIHSKSNTLL
jgi:hypothetical protein